MINDEDDFPDALLEGQPLTRDITGAYTAVLNNKVDCVIFTGGIGENSPLLHRLVCEGLYPLSHDNSSPSRDNSVTQISSSGDNSVTEISSSVDNSVTEISSSGDKPRVLVVKTNEELAIAKECVRFLGLS
jgi:acetate kinase